MNVVERARLKSGQRIKWQGRHFIYHGYAYKAYSLKEEGASEICVWLNGHTEFTPVYEHLSRAEILDVEVIKE